jgi:hypothetical protein
MTDAIVGALSMALAMGWEILWPLILGFMLSGVVQAVVSHSEMSHLLPDDRPRWCLCGTCRRLWSDIVNSALRSGLTGTARDTASPGGERYQFI